MINLTKYTLLINILCVGIFTYGSGNSGGNGGETDGLHFTESAQIAYHWMKDNQFSDWIQKINHDLTPETLLTSFLKSIDSTKIEITTQKLYVDKDHEKVALNYPDQKIIIINRFLWEASTKAEQIAIAAHEHFGIIGIDDSNYRYSSQIIKNFNRKSATSDLAVIAGRPNMNVGGIEQIVDQNIVLNPEIPETLLTTMIFSVLKFQGIQSVANLQILSKDRGSDLGLLLQAIDKSAQISPVVIVPFGPIQEDQTSEVICDVLARHNLQLLY